MRYRSLHCLQPRHPLWMAALALGIGFAPWVGAQEMPQEISVGTKLVASDGAEGDNFGSAVAVDGDVMAVAAPFADVGDVETAGAVYVFLRDQASGQWIEHQHLLPASGSFGDSFSELAVAVDGGTIVVGAPYTTIRDFQEGAVYVFERDPGGAGWGEVARLTDASVDHGGHFGSSIALDGNLLVVGAPQDSSARNGLVQIFERDRGGANAWGRITTLAHTSVNDAGYPRSFGSDVAVAGDLLVIGASRTAVSWLGQSDGAAYVFRRNETDRDRWDHVARLIVPGADQCVGGLTVSQFLVEATAEERTEADACADERRVDSGAFGHRVAIDGDTVVATAYFADGEDGTYSVGKAYVFQRDPGSADQWLYMATLSPSMPSPGGYFGGALALGGDAVLVGAYGTAIGNQARQGAAYLFERAAGGPDAWGEVARLLAHDGLGEGQFGSAVALEGTASIIGAKGDSTYRGALYIQEPAPPGEPTGPAFEPTGELLDDGIVEHAGGAMLGAVGTSLAEPLPVWIHEVAAPAAPLPSPAAPVGSFYNVGAAQTMTSGEGSFALALPVPEGADTTHLAAAILVPAHHMVDGPGAGEFWSPVRGTYNPELRLFSITLRSLLPEGRTVVLIDHPTLAPLFSGAGLRTGADAVPESEWAFFVDCFPAGWTAPEQCGEAETAKIAGLLKTAHDNYSALGFKEPALASGMMETKRENPEKKRKFEWVSVPTYRGIAIKDKDGDPECEDTRGIYAPLDGEMTICLGGGVTDAELTKTVRHELFHAVQHSSKAFHDYWAGIDWNANADGNYRQPEKVEDFLWFTDGTAEAAEDSDATMIRSQQHILHPTSRALTAAPGGPADRDKIAYQAQDFWVHFGRKKQSGLGYMKELFDRGGEPEAADRFFAELHQTSLGDEYWSWVKNQAMEKTIDFDNRLQSPCTIETGLVGTMRDLLYPPVDAPASVSGRLVRLTSEVVRIVTVRGVGPITVSATAADGSSEYLRYKVYREGEQDCVSAFIDGERAFPELPVGAFLYVIVSNLQHEAGRTLDYTVSVTATEAPPQ